MGVSLKQWGMGFALLGLIWLLYAWKPRVGAGAAAMTLGGVLLWQIQNKKGVFALD